jgi:hypothetical protein
VSILNVNVEAHRVLIAVDTASAYFPTPGDASARAGAVLAEASKLIPLVHINAVLAARGDVAMLNYALLLLGDRPLRGFDHLQEVMPSVLDRCLEIRKAAYAQVGIAALGGRVEVCVAGWSGKTGRMVVTLWACSSTDGPFEVEAFESEYLQPWCWNDDPDTDPPFPTSPESLRVIAEDQCKWARRWHPGSPIGGSLVIADVRRDTISIERQALVQHLGSFSRTD